MRRLKLLFMFPLLGVGGAEQEGCLGPMANGGLRRPMAKASGTAVCFT